MCADEMVTSVVVPQDTAVFVIAWPACLLGDGVAAAGASYSLKRKEKRAKKSLKLTTERSS